MSKAWWLSSRVEALVKLSFYRLIHWTDQHEGLGLMMAQALEANGAIVYILGRREEVLKQAAATAVS